MKNKPLSSPLEHGRATLATLCCWALGGAMLLLILIWLAIGELEWQTPIAASVVGALLAGIARLARHGRASLALGLLVGLLVLLVAADTSGYGLGSPASAGFILPIVLAACSLSLPAGLAIAAISAAIVWFTATTAAWGWYTPATPYDVSWLTFNAPAYTVLFALTALITGYWSRYLQNKINPQA